MLTSQLTHEVDSGVRERGADYFRRGAVRIYAGDPVHVEATVRGSEDYVVTLTRNKKAIKIWCSCPYYQENIYPCKHIWATLLAAQAKNLLGGGSTTPIPDHFEYDDTIVGDEPSFDDDEDDDYLDDSLPEPAYYRAPPVPPSTVRPSKPKAESWKSELAKFRSAFELEQGRPWIAGRQLLFFLEGEESIRYSNLILEIASRELKKNGEWSKAKSLRLDSQSAARLPEASDREIAALLFGAGQNRGYGDYGYSYGTSRFTIGTELRKPLLEQLCRTGRFYFRVNSADPEPQLLSWDDGGPWQFRLAVRPDESLKHYLVAGELVRGAERIALAQVQAIFAGGPVVASGRVAPLADGGAFSLAVSLRTKGPMKVPVREGGSFLQELFALPNLPPLDLPEELRFAEIDVVPRPRLKVKKLESHYGYSRPGQLVGELTFDYDGTIVAETSLGRGVYQPDQRRMVVRDRSAELAAGALLSRLGCQMQSYYGSAAQRMLASRNLPKLVNTLLAEGWHVEAEGKLYKNAGKISIEVNSGIDWFELHGEVEFGETSAKLPELLRALQRGENSVRLDDGTFGMLPQEWLKKYGVLAGLGTEQDGHLRFARTQVGLLDALLAAQPEATCDATFTKLREELQRFNGIEPADPSGAFTGELRAYQRDGLGWLQFLQKFSFGGCLADDMGLGKTVQVLALLESRRLLRSGRPRSKKKSADRPGPSLVVVPRSLIFNWKQEAGRFTPQLKILDYTGSERSQAKEHFDEFDVILTTYGTLRRDAFDFKDRLFDYVILDESQAIKNANSESAKAVRLLKGNHRLAMSGTPIENHLGELWSLFEFLNPGMLGTASVFKLGGVGARNPEPETRELLAKALRPFILRRTKGQVAKDLPEKTEQTLFCELEPVQRKLYDELRDHYRQALLGRIAEVGMNKAKIMILEALLRLRQAACHPGLIDPAKLGKPSAKLDALMPQLQEVLDEGQKVLVFSQFTSFLAILKQQLNAEKIPFEYLDGKTTDRASCVERFQTDPNCKLFLISLKAGGLGLNLTAAEYVFLLDPWWNPAVEAQAIDRTHRIGQTKPVFAYRLIAKDTVEEKVLELQAKKRNLADAIINEDNSLIRNLGREDLELLLS